MEQQQLLHLLQGISAACGGEIRGQGGEALIQLARGPAHRFGPEGIAAGEMAKQGGMAGAHAQGNRCRTDLIGRGFGRELQQGLHRQAAAFGGGKRSGPGHGVIRVKSQSRRVGRHSLTGRPARWPAAPCPPSIGSAPNMPVPARIAHRS